MQTSDSVSDDVSVKSPQNLCTFILENYIYRIRVSQNMYFYVENEIAAADQCCAVISASTKWYMAKAL